MNSRLNYLELPLEDATVRYYPQWLTPKHATSLFKHFLEHLNWQQPSIHLYGKEHLIPRLQAWYGEPDTVYEYSKIKNIPLPWESRLLKLKEACEGICKVQFNSVLANYYRHGQDSMGMHADDEPALGEQPVIASVSLGQARKFSFKHKQSGESYRLQLESGSLLIMSGDTQKNWFHGLNKSRTQTGPRLNFTFRWIHSNSNTTN